MIVGSEGYPELNVNSDSIIKLYMLMYTELFDMNQCSF